MNDGKRIEYIDSLRGFTMILVVAYHVGGFCLGIEPFVPSINLFLREFRMPLFFFISGFVLYKDETVWNFDYVSKFLLKKKFPAQIITTFFFFSAFIIINDINIIDGLCDRRKCGFWFTLVLFVFFCIYATYRYILNCINCKNVFADIFILFVGLLLFVSCFSYSVFTHLPIGDELKNCLSLECWGYFLYFAFGTLFKKYFHIVQNILDNTNVLTICLVMFFCINLYYRQFVDSHFTSLFELITAITGIIIVFSFFRIHKDWFKKEKHIGKCLQYVGRRTLDIYLLHYFFLPTNLKLYVAFLSENPMPIIEFAITLSITGIVILGCLIVSRVLRMSPILSYLLFGVKNR